MSYDCGDVSRHSDIREMAYEYREGTSDELNALIPDNYLTSDEEQPVGPSKNWLAVAVVVGILAVGGGAFGGVGLLQIYGQISLPASMHWLASAIGTIGNTPQHWSLWAITAGSIVALGASGCKIGSHIAENKRLEKETKDAELRSYIVQPRDHESTDQYFQNIGYEKGIGYWNNRYRHLLPKTYLVEEGYYYKDQKTGYIKDEDSFIIRDENGNLFHTDKRHNVKVEELLKELGYKKYVDMDAWYQKHKFEALKSWLSNLFGN